MFWCIQIPANLTQKQERYLSLNNVNWRFQNNYYVIRSLAVINSVTEEIFIDSNKNYPQSAQNISSIQPIRNYINNLINECNIDIKSVPVLPTSPQMPQWEHINGKFDPDYTDLKKSESTNSIREHLNNKYQNRIKIFTDGSILDSLDSGGEFVIPELKMQFFLLREVFFPYLHLSYM